MVDDDFFFLQNIHPQAVPSTTSSIRGLGAKTVRELTDGWT
jgi:hypothetical protein